MAVIITITTKKMAHTVLFGKPEMVFVAAVGTAATVVCKTKDALGKSAESAVNLMHVLVGEEVKRRIENVNN